MLLPNDDQALLRQAARELLIDRAGPTALRAVLETPTGHDPQLWKQIAALGWTAMALPEDDGGLGCGLADLAVVIEECGRALMPSALTGLMTVGWLVSRCLAPAQAAALVPGLVSGEEIVTWSVGGPDPTAAVVPGPQLELTGVRRHVPDVGVADHLVLGVDRVDGPALALVSTAAPGVTSRQEHTVDLTRRYHEVTFDGVVVSPEMLLASEPAVAEIVRGGVVLQCAESVGIAARAFDMTCEYVSQRVQFGRVIAGFQAVKHRMADMYMELEGARVATHDAAEAVHSRRPDADYAVHVAKSWTARAASMITSEAIQLHGGIGFTWEHDLHLLQRRAKANELLLGTPGWHEEQLTAAIADDGQPQ
jgi:alkylation response protein AidB-like acyl-CoA dehydrogenase